MKKFKRIILTVLISIIVNIIFPSNITFANNNDYELNVNYGIEGRYRTLGYIPINVEVTSFNEDFKGEIEVRVKVDNRNYDAYTSEININKGESIEVTIPTKLTEGSQVVTVHLIKDGKSVKHQNKLISEGRVMDNSLLVGILTDDMNALSYLGDVIFNNSSVNAEVNLQTVELKKEILETNYLNIQMVDLIILSNYNTASLSENQLKNLNTWIQNGGNLIVSAGANESKVIQNLNNILDIQSNGISEKNITIGNKNLNLILSDLDIDGAVSETKLGEETLLYSVEKGKGNIFVSTFDIGLEPFISSGESVNYFNEVFNKISNKFHFKGNYKYGYGDMSWLVSNIPIDDVLDTKIIGAVLVIYILIIGVILYLVLKKLRKNDLMWISIPIIAIITSGILYLLSSQFNLNEVILNQINIVDLNKDGEGTIKGSIGISTKYKDDMIVKKPKEILMNYASDDYYYEDTVESKEAAELRVKTTYTLDDSYFTFKDNKALAFKKFEVSGKEIIMPSFDGNFELINGNLNGSFTNNLDKDINRAIFVLGNTIWDLGTVEKGETITVKDEIVDTAGGILSYSEMLNQKYFDAKYNNKKEDDVSYKLISRHSRVLNELANEMIDTKDGKLLLINDTPIDYNIDFEDKSVSKYDTTVIMQDVNIDFTDNEGFISLPKGYFKGEIVSQSDKLYYDYYNGNMYNEGEGTAEVIIDYKLYDNINVSELTITDGIDRWGNVIGSGKLSIYNPKNNNYEEIEMNLQGYKVENASDYIKDGVFKLKIEIENREAYIPDITIKGVEK